MEKIQPSARADGALLACFFGGSSATAVYVLF
jgi:hypothetical protein